MWGGSRSTTCGNRWVHGALDPCSRGGGAAALTRELRDDSPCGRWLPSEAAGEPIDKGGWRPAEAEDARAFALGVLWVRAAGGFLPGFVTGDIDRARQKLDFVAA